MHGLGIAGMAVSALIGIIAMLTFVSVRWPDDTGRYVKVVIVAATVAFLTSASAAVFSAARDTYPHHHGSAEAEKEES